MPGTDPIRLGAAALSALVFETGSRVTTSDSGIQSCSVKATCADGANIFNLLPAAGVPFSAVFGNNYLPASFLVDYTDSGPEIEYLEGKIARVTFNFKRQDPTQIGVRKIFVDSVINYDSPLSLQTLLFYNYTAPVAGDTNSRFTGFGFPEPVVTVKYNSNSRPAIGSSNLSQLYALPGSSNAQGFPPTTNMDIPVSIPLPIGATVTYYDGTRMVQVGPLTVRTTANFVLNYRADVLGWKLMRVKSDPVAAANFYDVEEEWRTFYYQYSAQFVSMIPPP